MKNEVSYQDEYRLRKVILLAAVASLSLVFSFLFLQWSSYHAVFLHATVLEEMMIDASFFIFVSASYFSAAVLVWSKKVLFAKHTPAWLAISFLGSLFFSFSFCAFVSVEETLTNKDGFSFSLSSILQLLPVAFSISFFLLIITGFFTLITNYLSSTKNKELFFHLK